MDGIINSPELAFGPLAIPAFVAEKGEGGKWRIVYENKNAARIAAGREAELLMSLRETSTPSGN